MAETDSAGERRSAQEWAQASIRAWRWAGSTRAGSMEMEMGGGALALCLVDFGPEGVGVGEKSARVVRRATLTDVAAMAYPVVASLSNAVTCSRQR